MDISGHKYILKNTLFTWLGFFVNMVGGFIMPRLISDNMGQISLGIWDFTWSIVVYFDFVHLGLGTSVNRYVAMYRAVKDNDKINRSLSTVGCFMTLGSGVILLIALVMTYWILPSYNLKFNLNKSNADYVFLWFGLEFSIAVYLNIYRSVITGFHRWDLHNLLNVSAYCSAFFGMVFVIKKGGTLNHLAMVHCITTVIFEFVRIYIARKLMPEINIDRKYFSKIIFWDQFRYGSKNLIPRISEMFSRQLLFLVIATTLGPIQLAIFARYNNLIRAIRAIAAKSGYILVPTTSSLKATKEISLVRSTLLNTVHFTGLVIIPLFVSIGYFGDQIVEIWMGENYVSEGLAVLIVIGMGATVINEPVWSVMAGLNIHGKIAIVKLCGSFIGIILIYIGTYKFNWKLHDLTIVYLIPFMVIDTFIVPIYVSINLQIKVKDYYINMLFLPVIYFVPYYVSLIYISMTQNSDYLDNILCITGGLMFSIILILIKYKNMFIHSLKPSSVEN